MSFMVRALMFFLKVEWGVDIYILCFFLEVFCKKCDKNLAV